MVFGVKRRGVMSSDSRNGSTQLIKSFFFSIVRLLDIYIPKGVRGFKPITIWCPSNGGLKILIIFFFEKSPLKVPH
jgi:hypothetical protein